jgi:trigger factor
MWAQLEDARKNEKLDADDMGKTDDELREEYKDIAERRVRLGVLLSEVGRLNNIEVSQEEINRAIVQEAQRGGGNQNEILEYFQNNPDAQAQLRAPLFEDKVIDFILELASITDRETSADELVSDDSDDVAQSKVAKKAPKKKKAAAKKATTTKKTVTKK